MRSRQASLILVLVLCWIVCATASADDATINTPVVSASLQGKWELQTADQSAFKQTIHLGNGVAGDWQQSAQTLPTSIAWFVEGNELRILYYYEPNVAWNYRVKTVM